MKEITHKKVVHEGDLENFFTNAFHINFESLDERKL